MSRSIQKMLIALAAAALLLSGCTQGATGDDATPELPAAAASGPTAGSSYAKSCDEGGKCTEVSNTDGSAIDMRPPLVDTDVVKAVMADDRVTREEYETAFRNFSACMDGLGTPLLDVDTSRELIHFVQSNSWDPGGVCYRTLFDTIDSQWQMVETAKDDISADVEQFLVCFNAAGITPVVAEVPKTPRDQVAAFMALDQQSWEHVWTPQQSEACEKTKE